MKRYDIRPRIGMDLDVDDADDGDWVPYEDAAAIEAECDRLLDYLRGQLSPEQLAIIRAPTSPDAWLQDQGGHQMTSEAASHPIESPSDVLARLRERLEDAMAQWDMTPIDTSPASLIVTERLEWAKCTLALLNDREPHIHNLWRSGLLKEMEGLDGPWKRSAMSEMADALLAALVAHVEAICGEEGC